jgi:hypothetical protein
MRKVIDSFGNPMIVPEVTFTIYQSSDEWVIETYKNGLVYKDQRIFYDTVSAGLWMSEILMEEEVSQ